MNIEQMTDEEKSVALARLMGLEIDEGHRFEMPGDIWGGSDYWGWITNFYLPIHMALAWRVLNWALRNEIIYYGLVDWLYATSDNIPDGYKTAGSNWFSIFFLPPAEAQRIWLDKILSLAIEAGLVEDTK